MLLQDKVVLVVGASTGIGHDAALLFAEEGASVVVAARSHDALEELTAALPEGRATAVVGDVTSPSDVARMVDAAVATYGRLDGALNNAAFTQTGRLDEVPEDEFDRIMQVNVKGVWLCLREELRVMRAAGRGAIVNTASVAGYRGASDVGAYTASKHAVVGLSRTAAHDNGPDGIRVNVVAPGPTATPMLAHIPPAAVQQRLDRMPLRKLGQPREVAEAAAWLLSDRASHVTGVVLPVEGGYTA